MMTFSKYIQYRESTMAKPLTDKQWLCFRAYMSYYNPRTTVVMRLDGWHKYWEYHLREMELGTQRWRAEDAL